MQFAKYDEQGRVLFIGDVPESMLALQGERVFIGEIDGTLEYVIDGNKQPRPANPARLSGYALHNLPVPCKIRINQREYACSEASAAVELTYPGVYRINVQAFPFLDANFEVQV